MEAENIKTDTDDWIEENPLVQALLKESSLKKGELRALMLYLSDEEISFSDLGSKLGIKRSGAWKRWKKGYDKMIMAFYTIELGIYCDILDPEITKILIEDLKDYLKLTHRGEDPEAIRARLEKRMAELEKIRK